MTLRAALIVLAALLAGCTTPTEPSAPLTANQPFADLIRSRSGIDPALAGSRDRLHAISTLLASPLGVESAQQIALINNPGLLATYTGAGIAAADLQQAGLPQNPGFTFNRTSDGAHTVIDRTWSLSLVSLIMAPLATRLERTRFQQIQLEIADAALGVAMATRIAWIDAVAAQQRLIYAQRVDAAAQAGNALAVQMHNAGNWNALELQRTQLFSLQTGTALADARLRSATAREQLRRLLGLDDLSQQFVLPDSLPDLPAQALTAENAEAIAMAQRLDIQAGMLTTQRLANTLHLVNASAWLNVLDIGPAHNSGTEGKDSDSLHGYQISVSVPVFDWGQAQSARAESTYMQSVYRLADTAQQARSQVRLDWLTYSHSYQLARQLRDQALPLQQSISANNLLRFNAMQISIFDLLADAREQVAVVDACSDALRQFWIADATLERDMGGRLPAPPEQLSATTVPITMPPSP